MSEERKPGWWIPETRPASEHQVASWERNLPPDTPECNEAAQKVQENPEDPNAWMLLGHALAKESHYRGAANCYSQSIALDPFNWEYYRHRGHRFISCVRFADGAGDFVIASRLNPTDWNVWYHLGLAYFLLRMYDKAAEAYEVCLRLSNDADSVVAVIDWYWMTLRRLGKHDEAAALLDRITEGMPVNDAVSGSYYKRCLVYKGITPPEELFSILDSDTPIDELLIITQGFGLANYYEEMGDRQKSDEVLDKVIEAASESKYYSAFGCLAAMVDKIHRAAGN